MHLFKFKNRPQWKYVFGGSNEYIEKLIKLKTFKYYTNFKILKIIRDNNKIEIFDNYNNKFMFDKLIFATHADQVLSLLNNPTEIELNIFNKFKYSVNSAYLHTDSSLMPFQNMHGLAGIF